MNAPIGVFDSGLGGLTVAAALRDALPDEHLVYLGDTARVPYGTRSPATVVRYARNNVAFLRKQGVKLVVVACNTVSAQGLDGLTDGSEVPVVGVIRPGARAALEASTRGGGAIAVLGTPATIRSGAYVQAIHEHDPDREVLGIACPLFVPLVEEGWLAHPVTTLVAREYLAALKGRKVDAIILGCTHYPLLRETIAAVSTEVLGYAVPLVDSAREVARDVAALLKRAHLARSGEVLVPTTRRFCVTDAPERAGEVASRFWGELLPPMEHVDVMPASP